MTSILSQLSEAARGVAAGAGPAVVRVAGGWRPASGVVVADGVVITNAHNVRARRGPASPSPTAGPRRAPSPASTSTATSRSSTWTPRASRPSPFAPADAVAVGDVVVAVAAALDGGRVTLGFVSGVARAFRGPRGRRISGSIEHTAPMAPGSSGSAVLDAEGRLLGLNTNRVGGGFYLAMPADAALQARIAALGRGESTERPRLGVGLAPDGRGAPDAAGGRAARA